MDFKWSDLIWVLLIPFLIEKGYFYKYNPKQIRIKYAESNKFKF